MDELLKIAPWMAPVVILAGLYLIIEMKVWGPGRDKERAFRLKELDAEKDIAETQNSTAMHMSESLRYSDRLQERLHNALRAMGVVLAVEKTEDK